LRDSGFAAISQTLFFSLPVRQRCNEEGQEGLFLGDPCVL
jgi:hypothetical protein